MPMRKNRLLFSKTIVNIVKARLFAAMVINEYLNFSLRASGFVQQLLSSVLRLSSLVRGIGIRNMINPAAKM